MIFVIHMNGCHAKLRFDIEGKGNWEKVCQQQHCHLHPNLQKPFMTVVSSSDCGRGFELGNIAKLFHDNVILQVSQL